MSAAQRPVSHRMSGTAKKTSPWRAKSPIAASPAAEKFG